MSALLALSLTLAPFLCPPLSSPKLPASLGTLSLARSSSQIFPHTRTVKASGVYNFSNVSMFLLIFVRLTLALP